MKKEVLFATATHAFATHHPKFPWPKKNGLAEQNEQFKAAFDEICDFTETQFESGYAEKYGSMVEMYDDLLLKSENHNKKLIIENRDLSGELRSVYGWLIIVTMVLGAIIGGTIIYYMVNADHVCIPGPLGPHTGSTIETCL